LGIYQLPFTLDGSLMINTRNMQETPHKYKYGLIGNCAYLALISTEADISWLCWPRFDSSFIFGNLLDEDDGGRFFIQPEWETYTSRQQYLTNTNILETTFDCDDGSFRVIDFAPRFYQYERYYKPLMLIRKIEPLKGNPRVRVSCSPKGNYGTITPKKVFGSNHIRYMGMEEQLRITTNIPLTFVDKEKAFVLDEPKYLILTWGVHLEAPLETTAESYLEKTIKYWRLWVRNTSIENFHQDAVIRSALTLKIHQYQDTGAIIAAPTTSLPEFPGSTRNWDFRYCWLRDATFTTKALNDLSHFSLLKDYAGFIQNIVLNEDRRIRPLYPIGIDYEPEERILPLKGYRGERPVRIGNQAYHHIQNDVYGQVLLTLLPLFSDRRLSKASNPTFITIVNHCLSMIEQTLDEPDNGLWEFRGISQLHCYTFLCHWAGSQAARKIGQSIGDEELVKKASALVEKSSEYIEACYDKEREVYTQAIDNPHLDASLLQLINMGYLAAGSERAKKHLIALEGELKTPTGLFYRYKHSDDFGEPKSTFLLCAFWYVEALARVGRLEEATSQFEQLLKHTNHLGLLSEDIQESTGSQWGNFPQTYCHVGLINAAFTIARKTDKPAYL
jgi:GH15 family glucan-1,4-alpha-glucosidase